MKSALILLASLVLTQHLLGSEPVDIVFKSSVDSTEQRCVELLPPGYDEKVPTDAVLAFHGHGSDRWQFIKDNRGECRGVRDAAAKAGLILVSPDYRAKTSWMGPKAEADVLQIIAELKQRHKINRIFLAGGSMGGTAVLTFTALHPEKVAGVCSLNGIANLVDYEKFQDARTASFGGTKTEVPDEYKKRSAEFFPQSFTMPVAFTTGGKDDTVPPQSVLRLFAALKKLGRKVLSIHRDDGGHATTYEDTVTAMQFILREAAVVKPAPKIAALSSEDQRRLSEDNEKLAAQIAALRTPSPDLRADAQVFAKGITWALRYDTALSAADGASMKKALARGQQRADALAAGHTPWTTKKGKVLRGFVSAVDGSIQPYGLIIPQSYDGKKTVRLDVVLHGSSKPIGMSELRFGARFDEGDDETAAAAPEVDYIELHPLGRVENCYRWAGETDVFEAIEAACRNYRVDRSRIVLRGMSMGASGTWHLGLKHPDAFVAIAPYCGYVDTHRFSNTPMPGFIKVGPLPQHQELGLHMLDSVDYVANAVDVPAIEAIGDKDVFFQSHLDVKDAFAREGLQLNYVISPGTGHVIDPVTHQEQLRRVAEYADKGLNRLPPHLRFVTWTLKYSRCYWLQLLSLGQHYARAEIRADATDSGAIQIGELKNITRFAIRRPLTALRILGAEIPLPPHSPDATLVFTESNGRWTCEGPLNEANPTGKRPGLQGPIDDAFATPFVCVRGTGQPWNSEVNAWAAANLRRFEYEWARYMRGDLIIKNDTEVTAADMRDKNLILFGDPGSNSWIAKALPKLANTIAWTRDEVRMGGLKKPARDHAPVFIAPSPFTRDKYLVINSGHSFHEAEFSAFNYLLFPRLGDWAMMRIIPGAAATWQPTSKDPFPEQVLQAGYFDEAWSNPKAGE